jgi:hypothetical protein
MKTAMREAVRERAARSTKRSAVVVMPNNGVEVDKIKRFNWKMTDRCGKFYEIEKEELFIDPIYQRSKWNAKKVNAIAAAWSWVRCGTLTVAIRDNKWWVVDGATRKLAADTRSDIKKLPCMVHELADSIADEALSFVGINNSKTTVASCDRFKALIVGREDSAVGLERLFQSTGHRAAMRGGIKSIACLMTIWNLYQRRPQLVTDLWPLIAAVNEECHIKDTVFKAIFWAETVVRKQNLSLLQAPYRSFIVLLGGERINTEIKREAMIVGRGGMRVETNAFIKLINKKRIKGKEKIALME